MDSISIKIKTGQYYMDIDEKDNCDDELPNSEIGEIKLFQTIPENLTYPLIQSYLFKEVEEYYIEF